MVASPNVGCFLRLLAALIPARVKLALATEFVMRSFLLDQAENRESVACNYFLITVNFVLMVQTLTCEHFT